MKKLRADAEKSPLSNILIVVLLAVGFVSFPVGEIVKLLGIEYTDNARLLATALFRFVFGGVMLYLVFVYDFAKTLKFGVKNLLWVLPCLLVVINNFPIIGLIDGTAQVTAGGGTIALFVLYCLSVAFFEEIAFRALVFPLVYLKTRNMKRGLFWAFAFSSAIFGLVHLVNLFGGAGVGAVLLQVGYSFLIGGMCAVCMCLSGGIFVPVILHFVFDVGGLLIENVGRGEIWNLPTVIITAVLGVIVFVYMLFVALKIEKSSMDALIEGK